MTGAPARLTAALANRYRIERELGAGGMATVYLAADLKHDRKVAIKVLKPELAAVLGAERFVVEIKTTAALSHPHILPLFDSGEADGFLYYVMPYLQGETLRERLNRETQLGIEEAVKIASEVGEALAYAHEHGVIHRDIKPENILLHAGRPMVMDFGIALAVSAAAGGRMTETGLSLGTPHYMSPEQATADRDITARSDIYSLASVLYELLAGVPPHEGGSAQQTIMRIITETPKPVRELRRSVPPNVAAAVGKALEKLPADRFDSAMGFVTALADPGFRTASLLREGTVASVGRHPALVWGLASATVILAAALAWSLSGRQVAEPAVSIHGFLSDTAIRVLNAGDVSVSPDGATVFVRINTGRGGALLVRALNDDTFRTIDAVPVARALRVSPDNQSLLFVATRTGGFRSLLRMPVAGGPAVAVADSADPAGWCDDGRLVLLRGRAVLSLAEPGTPLVQLAQLDSVFIGSPSVLPDCRGLLFTDNIGGNGRLLLLDFRSGGVIQLAEQASNPRYVRSGHILFNSERPTPALTALRFDLRSRRVTGSPIVLVPQIGPWDLSNNGTLVYLKAPDAPDKERLAWVDMSGRSTPLPIQVPDFEAPRVSPDGRAIAFVDFNARALRRYDVSTGATTDLIGNLASPRFIWGADGRALWVSTGREILRVPTDGTGAVDTVYRGEQRVTDATPDEKRLVIETHAEGRGWDIDMLNLTGDVPVVEPYLRASWDERQTSLSPDGRWLAYVSNESGFDEVYVRAFPVPGDPVRISEGGGTAPMWAADGAAVFYEGPEVIMKAQVAVGGSGMGVRSRVGLFAHRGIEVTTQGYFQQVNLARRWDFAGGRNRFLMVLSAEEVFETGVKLRVITNFFDEIRQRTVVP